MHRSTRAACEARLSETSIFRLLAEQSYRLFPDEAFADLFSDVGRSSIPPRIVAVVMVLQRIFGMSDREAVDAFTFDMRWKYAAGALDFDHPGFVHTVLVDMRERLRKSERPNRIFEAVLEVAKEAGLVGRRRVLDSTALYDAVATQDTVTMIRSSIRALLRVAPTDLESELRAVLKRDDDYEAPGKPPCDWDDAQAREALVDALARDAYAVLACLDGRKLEPKVHEAAQLLATVVGQDLEQGDDGVFRIARRVAKDRIISTVDSEARHGHKTSARGFDGYKGHISLDPDSEIITATEVTAGNVGDGEVGATLLDEILGQQQDNGADQAAQEPEQGEPEQGEPEQGEDQGEPEQGEDQGEPEQGEPEQGEDQGEPEQGEPEQGEPEQGGGVADGEAAQNQPAAPGNNESADTLAEQDPTQDAADAEKPIEVYGDSSYGTADLVEHIERAGAVANTKVQPPAARKGMFSKADFSIDLNKWEVICPAFRCVKIHPAKGGGGTATFGDMCRDCPFRPQCTESQKGRKINIHPREATLQRSRVRQRDPAWKRRYRETRPIVERKFSHMMRKRHGGRRARVRGRERVGHDFSLLAAATNLARLARLGVRHNGTIWAC